MSPQRFRSKVVEIEAMQYTRGSRGDCIAWIGDQCRYTGIDDDGCEYQTRSLFIRTLEGEMECELGNWVIKGLLGEFYPCKAEVFEAKYEALKEAENG